MNGILEPRRTSHAHRAKLLGRSARHSGVRGAPAKLRVRATYGVNYTRLVALKRKYDPRNLFLRNANIDPSA